MRAEPTMGLTPLRRGRDATRRQPSTVRKKTLASNGIGWHLGLGRPILQNREEERLLFKPPVCAAL